MNEKKNKKKLTNDFGSPVYDNENSKTAGTRGPMLMEDTWYLEKMASFNREVIPERRMHAKGSGAFGIFTVTHDITKWTKAKIFGGIGKVTPAFVRFSTVAGERGAADAERDIRGFAMKFYTDEGNWDLVGNNTPVFFIRDAMRFPDLNKAVKRDPRTGLRNATYNWDFWSLLPEALHQVTITMSDRGIPKSYRHMNGYGSHTYSFINENNKRIWCKFHFKTMQGIECLTDQEAEVLVGKDRESHGRDLYESIEQKNFPRWELSVQIMTMEEADNLPYNPFDLTKVWYKKEFPLHKVGILELNRNPENNFQDVEQSAFNPANIVPGIGYSPDKMLQGRLFAYGDAQRYRLGINHHQIPVNAARPDVIVNSNHRDGFMRVDGNYGSRIHYWPNSFGEWEDSKELDEPALEVKGLLAHHNFREDDSDYYTQVGKLFNIIPKDEKKRLFENTARNMNGVPDFIKHRHIKNCYLADKQYGIGVAKAMDIDIKDIKGL